MTRTSLTLMARALWRLLDQERIDPALVFRQVQLDPKLMDGPRGRYRTDRLTAGWRRAGELIDNPCFGLRAAEHWQATDWHSVGYAFMASSTLRIALQRLCRYAAVIGDAIGFSFESEGDCGCLAFVDRHPDRPGLALPEEDALWALLTSLCRTCFGERFAAAEVRLMHAEPRCAGDYSAFFGGPVRFGAERSEILFRNADLDQPLPATNRELAQVNNRIPTDYLASLSGDDLVNDVMAALPEHLPSGMPGEAVIARAVDLSTRTLQRRLADSDTSFSKLLDTVRRGLAERYIAESRRSLAEISYLLGFSELSAFSRAFKRWTGESPGRYRLPAG